jgi:hypothetical protein
VVYFQHGFVAAWWFGVRGWECLIGFSGMDGLLWWLFRGTGFWIGVVVCSVLASCDGVLCGGLCVSSTSLMMHVNVMILASLL